MLEKLNSDNIIPLFNKFFKIKGWGDGLILAGGNKISRGNSGSAGASAEKKAPLDCGAFQFFNSSFTF
jgi:hypothetical protein